MEMEYIWNAFQTLMKHETSRSVAEVRHPQIQHLPPTCHPSAPVILQPLGFLQSHIQHLCDPLRRRLCLRHSHLVRAGRGGLGGVSGVGPKQVAERKTHKTGQNQVVSSMPPLNYKQLC